MDPREALSCAEAGVVWILRCRGQQNVFGECPDALQLIKLVYRRMLWPSLITAGSTGRSLRSHGELSTREESRHAGQLHAM